MLSLMFSICAPHSGKSYEEKENFWNGVFMKVGFVTQDEMVVVVVDMNDHVVNNNLDVAVDVEILDRSRILDFADELNLVISCTLFMKQEAKLVSCVSGCVQSTVDYFLKGDT